jgi:hypothetical protein
VKTVCQLRTIATAQARGVSLRYTRLDKGGKRALLALIRAFWPHARGETSSEAPAPKNGSTMHPLGE